MVKRIGFDVDDTLCPTTDYFLEWFNKKHNLNYKLEDFVDYDFSFIKEFTTDEVVYEINQFLYEFGDKLPSTNPMKFLYYLRNRGYELFIITAREKGLEKITKKWLENNSLEDLFEDIIMYNPKGIGLCKAEFAKKFGLTALIDDSPKYVLNAVENYNLEGYLKVWPWNKNIRHKDVVKFYEWDDLFFFF